MQHEAWARRLRLIPLLAALGAALSGCVCCGPRHYGDDDRRPGYAPAAAATEYDYIKALVPRGK